jgi:hypothetical protein
MLVINLCYLTRPGRLNKLFLLPGYIWVDAFAANKWRAHQVPTRTIQYPQSVGQNSLRIDCPDANVAARNGVYSGAVDGDKETIGVLVISCGSIAFGFFANRS